LHVVYGDVRLATLDLTDVRAVNAGPVPQSFLRKTEGLTPPPNVGGQMQPGWTGDHPLSLPRRPSSFYSLNLAILIVASYTEQHMRAQQRDSWVPSGPSAVPVGQRDGLTEVQLLRNVRGLLRRQLYSPARVRGGLLFGFHDGESLTLVLASTAGSPGWYDDSRFALGWTEALFELMGGRMDWVGNWITHADGQLRSEHRDHRLCRQGLRLGLLNDHCILLVMGWNDSLFECRTYVQGPDGELERLPCSTTNISLLSILIRLTSGTEP
jgi:hypothetical protein